MKSSALSRGAALALCLCSSAAAAGAKPTPEQALAQLETTDRRLLANERQLAALDEQITAAVRRRAYAQSMRALTSLRLGRAERSLRARLGVLARRQSHAQSYLMRGSKSLSHWLDAQRLWRTVAAHDQSLYQEVLRAHAVIDAQLASEHSAHAALREARSKARRTRGLLAIERRRRSDALAQLRRKPLPQALAARWHQQGQVALAALAAPGADPADEGLTADPTTPSFTRPAPVAAATTSPPRQRGLPWPATGPLRTRFGDRIDLTFGTVTRHNGIAIAAPAGTAVRSVAPGRVVFADWLSGFGRTVIVAHPGNLHSVHAHLHNMHVRRGQTIAEQEALGEVGDTGSLRGTMLYFELRQDGSPTDPLRLLQPAG